MGIGKGSSAFLPDALAARKLAALAFTDPLDPEHYIRRKVVLNEEKGQVQSGSVRRGNPSFTLRFPSGERRNVGLERVFEMLVSNMKKRKRTSTKKCKKQK